MDANTPIWTRTGRLATWSIIAALAAGAIAPAQARADWLQPDPSYREAQMLLRAAIRDTLHHANEPARLDSLGLALLRLGRTEDAAEILGRALGLDARDPVALAGLGKIALFKDDLDNALPLLEAAAKIDDTALGDLFAARIRAGQYEAAADIAADVNQQGREEMLRRMAETELYQMSDSKPVISLRWKRSHPVPLVRVRLNGRVMLMAIDTGASDLLIDDSAARLARVEPMAYDALTFWAGSRQAVRNAMVQSLKLGDLEIRNIPAGIISLRRWSLEVNPRGERVAGVIGLNLLRRLNPTLDYGKQRLILRRDTAAYKRPVGAMAVPFEVWGESELMVYGSLAGGRRMAMMIQTGVPNCGVGAPREVMEEIGVKPGAVARLVKGAGQWLQGVPWTPVTVPSVAIGPVVQSNVAGWQDALSSIEMWRHGVRRDALISHDFFAKKAVTIDWENHELVFENR
jgi:tetratricopeptide (TPR) repeat protein